MWAKEFASYLSPTATPGKNKHRFFTQEDMQVFSLVAELKKHGLTFAEIHANLKTGQRGDPPALPPEDVQALVTTDAELRLTHEVETLRSQLLRATEELKLARQQAQELVHTKEDNIRLSAQLESAKEYQQRLEGMIDRLNKRIEEMSISAGREYGRGVMDALARRGDLPEKDE